MRILPNTHDHMVLPFGTWTLADVGTHRDETTHYDDINEKTYSYIRRFVDGQKMTHIKDGAHVLDICCRTGNAIAYFSKFHKITAVGADVSDYLLKLAVERLQMDKLTNYKLVKFQSLPLPFADGEFDNVLFFETMEHMPDPPAFIAELFRVLKPNGEMLLTTPNHFWEFFHWFAAVTHIHHGEGPHHFIPRKQIMKIVTDAGFTITDEKTTVLLPIGPRWFTRLGEILEEWGRGWYTEWFGLRRMFICTKP